MSPAEAERHCFAAGGGIPNSALPAVILRTSLPESARDGDDACALLRRNGWSGNWLYGVYDFWHFHTRGHEVLACVAGSAELGLGGEQGIVTRPARFSCCRRAPATPACRRWRSIRSR
jgi:uncharacterized protein YjlB